MDAWRLQVVTEMRLELICRPQYGPLSSHWIFYPDPSRAGGANGELTFFNDELHLDQCVLVCCRAL